MTQNTTDGTGRSEVQEGRSERTSTFPFPTPTRKKPPPKDEIRFHETLDRLMGKGKTVPREDASEDEALNEEVSGSIRKFLDKRKRKKQIREEGLKRLDEEAMDLGSLIICHKCKYWRPNKINPPGGLGRCSIGAPASKRIGSLWPFDSFINCKAGFINNNKDVFKKSIE